MGLFFTCSSCYRSEAATPTVSLQHPAVDHLSHELPRTTSNRRQKFDSAAHRRLPELSSISEDAVAQFSEEIAAKKSPAGKGRTVSKKYRSHNDFRNGWALITMGGVSATPFMF